MRELKCIKLERWIEQNATDISPFRYEVCLLLYASVMLIKSRCWLLVVVLSVVFSVVGAACSVPGANNSEDSEEATPPPEGELPSVVVEEDIPIVETVWNCGAAKERVFTVVNLLHNHLQSSLTSDFGASSTSDGGSRVGEFVDWLSSAAENIGGEQESATEGSGNNGGISVFSSLSPSEAAELQLLVEAGTPLSNEDLDVFDAACQMFGQHEAALELWVEQPDDACDVWLPAKSAADTMRESWTVSALNPLVARTWVAATGDINEGYGRCLARRAN